MAIQVMIVDDSALVRQVLLELLDKQGDVEIMGIAADPLFAMQKMQRQWPDVVILDIEMPRMDGLTFLRQIQTERPTPVIICSAHTGIGSVTALKALEAGAFAIFAKPNLGLRDYLVDSSSDLLATIRAASISKPQLLSLPAPKLLPDVILSPPDSSRAAPVTQRIVAIGCSTGGTQALEFILQALPASAPGIAVVQHMPEAFTNGFAQRLNSICKIHVVEAKNGDRMIPGCAWIAPGGKHMLVHRIGSEYQIEIMDGPLVSRHRPSVDILFRSVAACAGKNAVGFLLTGMGDDGARGMKEMHDCGATTYAQDEETCVVYGMPKEAVKHGGVDHVIPLWNVAKTISAL